MLKSLIYCWWNRILSVSLFLFWIHIIPIFRKVRRKNSLSWLNFQAPFFYGWVASPESGWMLARLSNTDFCPEILFYSFYGRFPELAKLASIFRQCLSRTKDSFCRRVTSQSLAVSRHLYPLTSVFKLKILFQISVTKKCHFGAKGSMTNHLTFSFSHHSIQLWYSSDLDSLLCSTSCRS